MKYNKLTFNQNISRWDEAIPLGNGQMGCLIWEKEKELCLSLDRVDVWDTTTPFGTKEPEFTYSSLVKLARDKNVDKIREIFDAPYDYAVPTKLPVGKLMIQFKEKVETTSELRMKDACVSIFVKALKSQYQIKSFLCAKDPVGVIRILPETKECDLTRDIAIYLKNPEFGDEKTEYCHTYDPSQREISKGDLKQLRYPPADAGVVKVTSKERLLYFKQKVNDEFSYGIVAGVKQTEKEIRIFYRIVTTHDGVGWFENACEQIKEHMETGCGNLFKRHVKWWKHYWEKSAICLPDKEMEKQWYIANYLFASCSRKGFYPMPLQGVWTEAEDKLPPWKGDYHNDLNTQMSYYHYLKANHLKEGECFLDFLWNTRKAGETFAKSFYESEGHCLPAVMTIDGQPLGGWPMYSLSPTNQIWLCHAFAEYYRYTWDEKFLRERAYPYLKDTAECMMGIMEEKEDGYLYLPISSSPEIHDDLAESFVKPNSNYDLALLHFLFDTLVEYADILNIPEREKYLKIRNQLPELSVNESQILMISSEESLRESHRHFSHAMAVHPLRQIPYQGEKQRGIIDATIADLEQLGTKMWVGFSFCWMAELYAVQKNGEKAVEQLRIFWNYFCSPNGFHLNGDYKNYGYSSFHYRPFTLEANMCAADALQEMLMYMNHNVLEVFPAVPAEWEEKEVSFSRLRGEGGILISAVLKKGKLRSLVIDTQNPRKIVLSGWNQEGRRDRNVSYVLKIMPGEREYML